MRTTRHDYQYLMNMINGTTNGYGFAQRKELYLCIQDLLMDLETPSSTIKDIAKFIHKQCVKIDRQDVIESLELHNLVKG